MSEYKSRNGDVESDLLRQHQEAASRVNRIRGELNKLMEAVRPVQESLEIAMVTRENIETRLNIYRNERMCNPTKRDPL